MQTSLVKLGHLMLAEACLPEKPAPVREWISSEAWSLIREKAVVLRAFHYTGRAFRLMHIRFFFVAWASVGSHIDVFHLTAGEADLCFRRALTGAILLRSCSKLKHILRRDREGFLAARAAEVQLDIVAGRSASLWAFVRQMSGKRRQLFPRPRPELRDGLGRVP